jgi:hypothetical protein
VTAGRPRPRLDAAADDATLLPAPTRPGAARSRVQTLLVLVAITACFPANGVRMLPARHRFPAAALYADLVLAEGGDDARLQPSRSRNTGAADWSKTPLPRWGVYNLGPTPVPGGKLAFVSDRNAFKGTNTGYAPNALALQLWSDDRRTDAVAELEESMFRYPYLVSHAYLSPDSDVVQRGAAEWLRVLADGDTVAVRLAGLDDAMAGAIERGLRRALDIAPDGVTRAGIVDDLATLLEARERFTDAATLMRGEAGRSDDGRAFLARRPCVVAGQGSRDRRRHAARGARARRSKARSTGTSPSRSTRRAGDFEHAETYCRPASATPSTFCPFTAA